MLLPRPQSPSPAIRRILSPLTRRAPCSIAALAVLTPRISHGAPTAYTLLGARQVLLVVHLMPPLKAPSPTCKVDPKIGAIIGSIARCAAGYEWVPTPDGYRCMGGAECWKSAKIAFDWALKGL